MPPATQPEPVGAAASGKAAAVTGLAGVVGTAATEYPLVKAGQLEAKAVKEAIEALLAMFGRVFRRSRKPSAEALLTQLRQEFPQEGDDDLRKIVRDELDREDAFQRKMLERLRRDLPDAFRDPDPLRRRDRVQQIVEREKRYLVAREQAMAERAIAAVERMSIRRMSPWGAYWSLSPYVHNHTPDCVALSGHAWPWAVLDLVSPPVHHGCGCFLLAISDAIEQGLMTADRLPDVKDAIRRAKSIMDQYAGLREAAQPWEIEEYMKWLQASGKRQPTQLSEAYDEVEHPRDRLGHWIKKLGIPALKVGGAVRDPLLGKEPKDIDYVVRAHPDEIRKAIERTGHRADDLIVRDRVVGLRAYGPEVPKGGVDLAPPRIETSIGPERHDFVIVPHPEPHSDEAIRRDALRRDFTINALYEDEHGAVLDPTGHGLEDARNRQLRVVSDQAFREDPLRILRGLRLMSQHGLTMTPDTEASMRTNADAVRNLTTLKGGVSGTARDELNKLLMGDHVADSLRAMRDTGVLGAFLPELDPIVGFDQQSKYHDLKLDDHTIGVVDQVAKQGGNLTTRLAALFHDSGKPDTAWAGPDGHLHFYGNEELGKKDHAVTGAERARETLNRLDYPEQIKRDVVMLVENHMVTEASTTKLAKVRKLRQRVGDRLLPDLLVLRRADMRSKGTGLQPPEHQLDRLQGLLDKTADDPLALKDLAVNGSDLVKMGIQGRAVGETLQALLASVVGDPTVNRREVLLKAAAKLNNVRYIQEGYDLRWPKGTAKAGEFRPRRGGNPGIRKAVFKVLHQLLPHMPSTPAQRAGHGEWKWAAGRRVFVPEQRHFERKIGGRTYTSPPDSVNLYKDGKPVESEHERGTPGALRPGIASPLADHVQQHIAALSPAPGEASQRPLRDPGDRPLRRRPPANWSDFQDETAAIIDTLGRQYSTKVVHGDVIYDPNRFDDSGLSDWEGNIYFGRDTKPTVERDEIMRQTGRKPTDADLRTTFNLYRAQAHEASHNVNPADKQDYVAPGGQALEEALAEEVSHTLAAENLERHGRYDAIAWSETHPYDEVVRGTYRDYRQGLRQIFKDSGMPHHRWADMMFELKFETPPSLRVEAMEHMGPVSLTRAHILNAMIDQYDPDTHLPLLNRGPAGRATPGAPEFSNEELDRAVADQNFPPSGYRGPRTFSRSHTYDAPTFGRTGLRYLGRTRSNSQVGSGLIRTSEGMYHPDELIDRGPEGAADPGVESARVMYHVTPKRNLDSIRDTGLSLPTQGTAAVWLTDDHSVAEKLAKLQWAGSKDNAIVPVDVTGMHIEPDPHPGGNDEPYRGHSFITKEAIPADRVLAGPADPGIANIAEPTMLDPDNYDDEFQFAEALGVEASKGNTVMLPLGTTIEHTDTGYRVTSPMGEIFTPDVRKVSDPNSVDAKAVALIALRKAAAHALIYEQRQGIGSRVDERAKIYDNFEYVGRKGAGKHFRTTVDTDDSWSTTMNADDGSVTVEGEIQARSGKDWVAAGHFRRVFTHDSEGKLVVEHAIMKLDEKYQGEGFATAFNRHAEEEYRKAGVDRIEIETAWVGSFAWARAGYLFAPLGNRPTQRSQRETGVKAALALASNRTKTHMTAAMGRVAPESLRDQAIKDVDTLFKGIGAARFDSESSLAGFGIDHSWVMEKDDKWDSVKLTKGERVWVGKLFLLDQSWSGYKPLKPVVQEAYADGMDPEREAEITAEVFDEFEGRMHVSPDDISGDDEAAFWAEVVRRSTESLK